MVRHVNNALVRVLTKISPDQTARSWFSLPPISRHVALTGTPESAARCRTRRCERRGEEIGEGSRCGCSWAAARAAEEAARAAAEALGDGGRGERWTRGCTGQGHGRGGAPEEKQGDIRYMTHK